ncbi:DUF262 domain-containing HNH endonuclease family protein [Clostridium gasigenes]|uniref:DUF262 domain-containing protein n=1 Tax=Clostridium gasigenes TaxID=94869 RepID=UPI001C0B22DB|nr:DUF262 domain-containing protein [Clostridium gasigenes]MBU3090189.1 DUF262 domain-containing HNH endonuclease family protein [Clostridium gasigenes]
MNFEYNNMQIRTLLGYNNKRLYIPRYQRDYSWGKEEITEFLNDILSEISINNEKELISSEYFFGTILLAGSFNESGRNIEVIDGQQRITTMTIFLSALAKNFYTIGNKKLGNLVWVYIMKEDDNGEHYKILKNDTTNHYFEYLIQMKEVCNIIPIDEEQEKIKEAYEYFINILKEDKLIKRLKEVNKNVKLDNIEYLDILKVIRDQLLNSNIICISTKDKKSANSIFEILNAKGKKLESIDLIKNSIFNYLDTIEPTDHANNIWKNIKNKLVSRKERVEFSTFFRHYWISKYNKVKDDQLYREFTKTIKKENYKEFLEELEKMADLYIKIICPLAEDYENKKQYMYILESLKYLNDYFNIKQIRVLLLALFEARINREILTNKKFKEILVYLHGFHFTYNALCTKRSNALEGKYSRFAIKLNKAKDKQAANKIIDELKENLDATFPSYEEFEQEFIKLEFSKQKNKYNMLSKYALNNIEKHYSRLDTSPINGSIEHILGEDVNRPYTLNIGNIILLEENLNNKAEDKDIIEKINIYEESSYKYVLKFREDNKHVRVWNEEIIRHRAKQMAKLYYVEILGKKII